jgi:hypothetical protein
MPAFIFLIATNVFAFELARLEDGSTLRWEEQPITYVIDTSDAPEDLDSDEQIDSINAAFDVWTTISGASIDFNYSPAGSFDPSANIVRWSQDWPYDANLLAYTINDVTTSGRIVRFEILINRDGYSWATDENPEHMDLQNCMTHEVGHALGLDHPAILAASMHPMITAGEIHKRDLHIDDEDGIRTLYAPQEVISPGCFLTSNESAAGLFVFPLPFWLRRRRSLMAH